MTNKEAVEILQEERDYAQFPQYVKKAIEIATAAIEKQIPKKPIQVNYIVKVNGVDTMLDENEFTKCPSCTFKDIEVKHGQKYCHICGQLLDWSAK